VGADNEATGMIKCRDEAMMVIILNQKTQTKHLKRALYGITQVRGR
jgi:hypothetical protein